MLEKNGSIIERCVNENGDPAITHYNVISSNYDNNFDVVECILETGRTHQIRVHFSYIKHPLLGDSLYGIPTPYLISRQALHSYYISFIHPIEKTRKTYQSKLPPDMLSLIS